MNCAHNKTGVVSHPYLNSPKIDCRVSRIERGIATISSWLTFSRPSSQVSSQLSWLAYVSPFSLVA